MPSHCLSNVPVQGMRNGKVRNGKETYRHGLTQDYLNVVLRQPIFISAHYDLKGSLFSLLEHDPSLSYFLFNPFIERLIRLRGRSTERTRTSTISPDFTTSRGLVTNLSAIWLLWTSPS